MVGALVSTALVFESTDAAYYDRLMTQALSLYGAGMRRRGKYSDVFLYDCAPRVRALTLNLQPQAQVLHRHARSQQCLSLFLHDSTPRGLARPRSGAGIGSTAALCLSRPSW